MSSYKILNMLPSSWPSSWKTFIVYFTIVFASLNCSMATATRLPPAHDVVELRKCLSENATISPVGGDEGTPARPRWSTYEPPQPKYVVKVATEEDVARTVSYCVQNNLKFLAQNGASGWASTFDLGDNGILIDMAQLSEVTVSSDKTQAKIGGGARIKQTVSAANDAGVVVLTGNCNCVGTLGALLGGGYGYLSGLYGMGVDNVISLRAVLSDGKLHDITAQSDADLFWAMRGAGPNFGIVTSAIVRAHPQNEVQSTAWSGPVVFSPDQLEEVVNFINELDLEPEMNIFMYFVTSGPPDNAPVIVTTPFQLGGTNESGHQKFAKLFDIGPLSDGTGVVPYKEFNTGGDMFCTPGSRKPGFGAGFKEMVPSTWKQLWDLFSDFQKKPTAENTAILLERYSMDRIQSFPSSSAAFPNRHVEYNVIAIPIYTDASLDEAALEFGRNVRSAIQATDGYAENATYVNFAQGDEDLKVVYGDSLPRLREIKKKVDPDNVLNQWFDIR